VHVDLGLGVQALYEVGGALRLRAANILQAMDGLALQVGDVDGVIIDDAYVSDAGRRELLDHR
jgi:hypothetical protein